MLKIKIKNLCNETGYIFLDWLWLKTCKNPPSTMILQLAEILKEGLFMPPPAS